MELLTDGFLIGLVCWLVVVGALWWVVGQSLAAPPERPRDLRSPSREQPTAKNDTRQDHQ